MSVAVSNGVQGLGGQGDTSGLVGIVSVDDAGCGSVDCACVGGVTVTAARIHRLVWTTTGDPDEGQVWACLCMPDGHFGRNHHRAHKAWAKHVEEETE